MTTHGTINRSFSHRWDDFRPSKTMLFWACAATLVATIVVGFAWGGWVTGGTSKTMAAAASAAGRGELASAICVQRFNAASDAAAKRIEFKALADNYRKRQFVEAGGWAVMPGQTTSDGIGVDGCVTALSS